MKNKAILAFAVVLLVGAASAFAANTLAVNAGAALGGTTFGMQLSVDPAATNAVYVQSDHPNAETHMRIVWRMKLDTLAAPASGAGRNFRFMNMGDADFVSLPHKIFFVQRQVTTGNWRLAVWSYDTTGATYVFAGGHFLGTYGATFPDVQEECDWTMATAPSNGILTCTRLVPAGQSFSVTNLNDQSRQTDFVQLGFFDFDGFPGAAAASSAKFDEYESYR